MSVLAGPPAAAETQSSDIDSASQHKAAYVSEKITKSETAEGEVIDLETYEVFKKSSDAVDFRTVSWQSACVMFTKIEFAMSILVIPSALGALGAVGGGLSLLAWDALNTCRSIAR